MTELNGVQPRYMMRSKASVGKMHMEVLTLLINGAFSKHRLTFTADTGFRGRLFAPGY